MRKQAAGFLTVVLGGMVWASAGAAEVRVLASNAIKEAYIEFAPLFEKTSGHSLDTTWDGAANILKRLRAGETFDMVVLTPSALKEMIEGGHIAAGSGVDLVRSGVGIGVPQGAARPDISSGDAIRKVLLAARGIGYSSGPSGIYLDDLFKRWGIADAIKDKLKRTPPGVPVGDLIAKGEVDIGFQQVSELMHFPGIQYVGPLPPDIQYVTTFSGGVHSKAKEPEAARALLKFIVSPVALPFIRKSGMEQGGEKS